MSVDGLMSYLLCMKLLASHTQSEIVANQRAHVHVKMQFVQVYEAHVQLVTAQ